MAWIPAAASLAGSLIGAFGNKSRGPSLAENMSDMGSIFGQRSGLTAAGGYRDLGPPQYYPHETYGGYSPQTQAAIQALFDRGMGGPGQATTGATDYLTRTLGGAYLNANPSQPGLGDIAGAGGMGGYNTVSPLLQQMAGQSSMAGFHTIAPQLGNIAGERGGIEFNPAYGGLSAFGGGAELAGNPYLDAMYGAASRGVTDQFRNAVAPSLMSGFSAAGRTGSGAAQGAFGQASQSLGNTLRDLGSNMYGSAYETGRGRQLSALNSLSGAYNTGIGNQLSALNLFGNQYNQGFSNQLNALGALDTSYNRGIGNRMGALDVLGRNYNVERGLMGQAAGQAPSIDASRFQGLNAALGAGQLLDADTQARIDANRERFEFGQNAPRDFYSSLVGLYSGTPQPRIQGQQPQPYNRLAGGLGGALIGGQLGSMFSSGFGGGFGGGGNMSTFGGGFPSNSVFSSANPFEMPNFGSFGSSFGYQ